MHDAGQAQDPRVGDVEVVPHQYDPTPGADDAVQLGAGLGGVDPVPGLGAGDGVDGGGAQAGGLGGGPPHGDGQ